VEAHGESLNSHSRHGFNVERWALMKIYRQLQECNSLVQECHQIGQLASSDIIPPGGLPRELIATINQRTSVFFDIAAITSTSLTGNRMIVYQLNGERKTRELPVTHALLEPLCYPLLFPYGTGGWGINCGIDFMDYLCCRMLMPDFVQTSEYEGGTIVQEAFNKAGNRKIPVNRMQAMSRLGQHYVVDMISRIIDYRLSWHSRNQELIRGPQEGQRRQLPSDNVILHDISDSPEDTSGTASFLSQSMHGSRRHLKKLAKNALAIVSEFGKPTLFITLTCNPHWPEIQEMLLPNQTAFDRTDIVCQVFKARLTALLQNIRDGKYFDDLDQSHRVRVRRKVIYELRCIEYQHRGLPHAHIVIKFSDSPESSDPDACSAWIDNFISCCYPNLNDESTENDHQYAAYVTKHMTHKCASAVNGCLDSNNLCKKGYMDTIIQDRTTFDIKGFPIYKRLNATDLRVVPHNRGILMDWEGHAYVDWCASTYTVLYLYQVLSICMRYYNF
jgi:hypothetical protein